MINALLLIIDKIYDDMLSIDFGVQIYLIINGYNIPKTNDRNKPIINYKNYVIELRIS